MRPVQIYWCLVFKLAKPRPPAQIAEARLREISGKWVPIAERQQCLFGPTVFRVLNIDYDIAIGGWNPPNKSKLLSYNLHYFDDLKSFTVRYYY